MLIVMHLENHKAVQEYLSVLCGIGIQIWIYANVIHSLIHRLYTETFHSLESYILIDEHVVGHKHKWAVAVRQQVFLELENKKGLKHLVVVFRQYLTFEYLMQYASRKTRERAPFFFSSRFLSVLSFLYFG